MATIAQADEQQYSAGHYSARALCIELAVEINALLQREQERSEALIHDLCSVISAMAPAGEKTRVMCRIVQSITHDMRLREPRIADARKLASSLERAA